MHYLFNFSSFYFAREQQLILFIYLRRVHIEAHIQAQTTQLPENYINHKSFN